MMAAACVVACLFISVIESLSVDSLKNILFTNVWRKNVFDICLTGFGTALTTILPILFQYCYT